MSDLAPQISVETFDTDNVSAIVDKFPAHKKHAMGIFVVAGEGIVTFSRDGNSFGDPIRNILPEAHIFDDKIKTPDSFANRLLQRFKLPHDSETTLLGSRMAILPGFTSSRRIREAQVYIPIQVGPLSTTDFQAMRPIERVSVDLKDPEQVRAELIEDLSAFGYQRKLASLFAVNAYLSQTAQTTE